MFTHERRTRASGDGGQRALLGQHLGGLLLCALMFAAPNGAQAHGIIGNRVFPGTLAFDDPAVMDELVFPAVSSLKHPREGADVTDNRIGLSFLRLLAPLACTGRRERMDTPQLGSGSALRVRHDLVLAEGAAVQKRPSRAYALGGV